VLHDRACGFGWLAWCRCSALVRRRPFCDWRTHGMLSTNTISELLVIEAIARGALSQVTRNLPFPQSPGLVSTIRWRAGRHTGRAAVLVLCVWRERRSIALLRRHGTGLSLLLGGYAGCRQRLPTAADRADLNYVIGKIR